MSLALWIIVIVLALYYFASGRDGEQQHPAESERELLHLCLGDQEQVERLLRLELDKAPGIKRGEAVRRAIRSLRRDAR
jgi:hypothetical protein